VAAVTTKGARLGYSSQGPGGLDQHKPDLAAYSHFDGSKVYSADSGTSAACPVAAGVVAALRQGWPTLAPLVSKGILQKACEPPNAPWNYDLGYGILNG
jgi:subtilisin family serine protease